MTQWDYLYVSSAWRDLSMLLSVVAVVISLLSSTGDRTRDLMNAMHLLYHGAPPQHREV